MKALQRLAQIGTLRGRALYMPEAERQLIWLEMYWHALALLGPPGDRRRYARLRPNFVAADFVARALADVHQREFHALLVADHARVYDAILTGIVRPFEPRALTPLATMVRYS
jgi:hypothetical protein